MDQIIESPERDFEGGMGIEGVQQVEVDVVCAESFETRLDAAHQIQSVEPASIGSGTESGEDLRRQHDLVTSPLQRSADHLFRSTLPVEGGVDEVAAQIHGPFDDPHTGVFILLASEGRAQAYG